MTVTVQFYSKLGKFTTEGEVWDGYVVLAPGVKEIVRAMGEVTVAILGDEQKPWRFGAFRETEGYDLATAKNELVGV